VASDSSRQLAESIASHVPGVTKVNNNLTVGTPQVEANAGDQQPADNQPDPNSSASSTPAPGQSEDLTPLQAQIRAEVQAQIQAHRQAQQQNPSQNPPARPPAPSYIEATGPVTIPEGTLLQLRTSESVSSKHAKNGTPVQFIVIHDVAIGGVLAIPRGATVHGVVTEARAGGDLGGAPELALKLTSLELGGQSYPLDIGGAIMGTIIGCASGRGVGCAIGAAAGAGVGTAASAAAPRPNAWIPSEARVDFHLATALTVTPVSSQEAARLAQGLNAGGPALYRRGYYPNGQPYYYLPQVYYRPYYMADGYYYWR
jgi:hypothetical protein